jgi:hypothetical protein
MEMERGSKTIDGQNLQIPGIIINLSLVKETRHDLDEISG